MPEAENVNLPSPVEVSDTKAFFLERYGPLAKGAGIYRIAINRSDLPPKFYIGQGVNISKRWASHLHLLRRGDHWNGEMQSDFVKYGIKSLAFEILIVCERNAEILALYEQAAVDAHDIDTLYNLWTKCTKTGAGTPASPERKAKIAARITGLKRSRETRDAIGRAQAWKRTPEGRAKMSAVLREAAKKRPPMSEEERAYRSRTTTFRNLSPESKQKSAATREIKYACERTRKAVLEKSTEWILYGA
jgi:group I intron endonuclease